MGRKSSVPEGISSSPLLVEIQAEVLDTKCLNPWKPPFVKCLWTVTRGTGKSSSRCSNRLDEAVDVETSSILDTLNAIARDPPNDKFYDNVKEYLELTHCPEHRPYVVNRFHTWKADKLASDASPAQVTQCNPVRSRRANAKHVADVFVSTVIAESEPESEDDACSDSSYQQSVGLLSDGESVNFVSSPDTTPETTPVKKKAKPIAQRAPLPDVNGKQKGDVLKQLGAENVVPPKLFTVVDAEQLKANHLVTPFISRILTNMESGFDHHKKPRGKVYVLTHKSHPGLFKVGYTAQTVEARKKNAFCTKKYTRIVHESEEAFAGARKVETLVIASLSHRMCRIISCGGCGLEHKEWFHVEEKDIVDCVEAWTAYVKSPVYDRGFRTDHYHAFSAKLFDLSPERVLRVVNEVFPSANATEQAPSETSEKEIAESHSAEVGIKTENVVEPDAREDVAAAGPREDAVEQASHKKCSHCDEATGATDVTAAVKGAAVENTDSISEVPGSGRYKLRSRATFSHFQSDWQSGLQSGLAKLTGSFRKVAGGTKEKGRR